MTSDTLIIIMAVIAATSSVVTMVGIIFPRIFFPSHVSHRRWKILGLWFGFVFLLVGYEQLTTMLMHNVPPLFVYLHLLLTILAVATVIPKVNPFKNKFNGEKKWFPLIGVIAVDALFLSIGYVCVKLGSTPMEGSANEKWVSKQISLLQNDSKELQRIEAIDITDTASVVYLRGLIAHVDSLGKPHLHSPYDSLFYYTDARISGISHQNQKRSKQIKYWCPLKLFFAAEKIRLNPVAEVQPFSLPLFSPQKPGNMNKDEQRYTFYRTAVVWSAH